MSEWANIHAAMKKGRKKLKIVWCWYDVIVSLIFLNSDDAIMHGDDNNEAVDCESSPWFHQIDSIW